jgi:hypothetical protein
MTAEATAGAAGAQPAAPVPAEAPVSAAPAAASLKPASAPAPAIDELLARAGETVTAMKKKASAPR